MDTSSSTGSASEKLSEGEETPNSKGDAPDEPMVGSPPLFTAIPSTSAMMIASDISSSCHDIVGHTEGLFTNFFCNILQLFVYYNIFKIDLNFFLNIEIPR